jgi:hypothetical protein
MKMKERHLKETEFQADRLEVTNNKIKSDSSVITRVQISNQEDLLTIDPVKTDSATELTVYNNNLSLVKEKRELELKAGINRVEYSNVAAFIDPTSVIFEDTKNKDTIVLEQNYEYDLVSDKKLLEKFLDKKVTVTENGGSIYTGTLLSNNGGVVLRLKDGKVVTLSKISNIEFPDSAGLLTKPTLIWQIYSPTAGKRDVLTSYLTSGMNWKANYIVKTNVDDTAADIQAWVSIDNTSGTTFEDAKLKLVAGEVHRAVESDEAYMCKICENTPAYSKPKSGFVEETFFEYHLYTLERPTTLKNKQVKQISLLSADSVPVEKELVFEISKSKDVRVVLNLKNSKEKGLGMPLPAGVIRVYKADTEGQLQFLGEDNISHTPKDETFMIVVGNAFDITGNRIKTDYKKVDSDFWKENYDFDETGKKVQTNFLKINSDVWRESYEIELKNHKSEAQKLKIIEHFYGDWEIIESSDTYDKTDAFSAKWKVEVAADSSKKVSYVVKRSY